MATPANAPPGRGRVGSLLRPRRGRRLRPGGQRRPGGDRRRDASTRHGDVIATASRRRSPRPAQPAQVVAALTTAAATGADGRSRRPSGSRWSAPPTRSTAPPAAWSTCPTRRSCSASCPRRTSLAGLVDGPVMVDNDVNWAARAERDAGRHRRARRLRLPAPRRGPRLRRRQRRRGTPRTHRPRRRDRPRPHDRPRRPGRPPHRRVRRARPPPSRHRRRSTCTHCWRRSNPTMREHAICGQPWPGRSAASSPPWSPSPTPQLVVIGGTWGTEPVVLDTIAARVRATPPPRPDPGRATHRRTLSRRRQEPCTPRASGGHRDLHPIALSRYEPPMAGAWCPNPTLQKWNHAKRPPG